MFWAKVTFDQRTKRIASPAASLPEFLVQIQPHFAIQNPILLWDNQALWQESQLLSRSVHPQQVTKESYPQIMQQCRDRNITPRFILNIPDSFNVFDDELGVSIEYYQEVPSQMLLGESQILAEDQHDSYEIIPDLDDLIEQKIELSSDDDEEEVIDCRDFVRAVLAAQGPVVFAKQLELRGGTLDSFCSPPRQFVPPVVQAVELAGQQEMLEIKVEENKDEVQNVYLSSELTQREQPREKPIKQFFTGLMTSVKQVIQNDQTKVELAKGQERDVYCEVQCSDDRVSFEVNWKFQNNQSVDWPSGLQLLPVLCMPAIRPHSTSKISQLRAGGSAELTIKFELPRGFTHQHIVMLFKMRDAKQQFLGPNLFMVVKLIQQTVVSSERSAFEDLGDDLSQSNMLRRSVRSESFNDDHFFTMAGILADEGFGEFERCSKVARALRGDMEACRSLLSQVIICEDQLVQATS